MQLGRLIVTTALVASLATPALAAGGSRSNTPEPQETQVPADPKAEAREHYNRGLMQRDRAWKIEEKIAGQSDAKKAAKQEKKLANAWRSAQREFESAVEKDPQLYPAHSSLGYVLRRQGYYEASLAAYDRALAIEPRYAEAVEYRAEAYLNLGRLDEVKEAYLQLFQGQPKLAAQLMNAMKTWLESNADAPGASELAAWVAQREEREATAPSPSSDSGW